MKLEISRQTLEKHSDIKFHENPSSGSRTVPCRRKDMTKLIGAFRRLANAPGEDRKTGERDFIELVDPKSATSVGLEISQNSLHSSVDF